MDQNQSQPVSPIFASVQDMRQRMKHCQSCAQRREIIQRWLLGQQMQTMGMTPQNVPRDMSALLKEK